MSLYAIQYENEAKRKRAAGDFETARLYDELAKVCVQRPEIFSEDRAIFRGLHAGYGPGQCL